MHCKAMFLLRHRVDHLKKKWNHTAYEINRQQKCKQELEFWVVSTNVVMYVFDNLVFFLRFYLVC